MSQRKYLKNYKIDNGDGKIKNEAINTVFKISMEKDPTF